MIGRVQFSFVGCGLLVAVGLIVGGGIAQAAANESGTLLIANTTLRDPNFSETVVLVTSHGQQGTVGVVVNRPTSVRLAEVFEGFETLKALPDHLNFGGPVSPRSFVFLMRAKEQPSQSLHVFEDVYISNSYELLTAALNRDEPTAGLRIYAGFAGWAPGQLENEIARGDWFTMKAQLDLLFNQPVDNMWPTLIRRFMGRWVHFLGSDSDDSTLLAAVNEQIGAGLFAP